MRGRNSYILRSQLMTVHWQCLISGYQQLFLCSSTNYVRKVGMVPCSYTFTKRCKDRVADWNRCHEISVVWHSLSVCTRLSPACYSSYIAKCAFVFIFHEMPLNMQTCFLASMTINFKSKSTNYQIKVLSPFSPVLCRIYLGLVTLIAPDY